MEKEFILNQYFFKITYACIIFICVYVPKASSGELETFIADLKLHYQNSSSISAFSLTHRYLGRSNPYQSWDYKTPSRYQAFKVTDIDLTKKHYAQNVVHNFTGNLYFDEVHFQNDSESLRYERNGISIGKRVIKQSLNSFERYKNLTLMNVDFFAVRPLLEENLITKNISFFKDPLSSKVTLTHQVAGDILVEYEFNTSPLRLLSINNKLKRRIYNFDDYQTTNGLTFARSLVKYYNGDSIPSIITRIEKFEILEKVEPTKLVLPKGYGPVIPKADKHLTSQQIASDIYLVTDSSASRNTLFKVNDEDIMVFGAPVSTKLSEQTIKLILEPFPNKKITSVFVTHPHSDHIAGLPAFVKHGVTVYADFYTIEAIKAYDRFADNIDQYKFKTIEHEDLIDGVRFHILESSQAKRQSFAYFEDDGIIYQSDFLEVAFDNTIAKILPSYSKAFIDFVRNKKIKINRIVGHHRNNNISMEVVNKSYQANTM